MRYNKPVNLLLALIVAFWTPMWCCCAAHGHGVVQEASHESPACPNCLENESSSGNAQHLPESSTDSDCPTCPHKLQRSWGQVEKSPQLRVEVIAPCFYLPPSLMAGSLLDSQPLAAVAVVDAPPDVASVSLISLHCMLTI